MEAVLASHHELSQFLAGIERRAFKHAVFAVQQDAAALDIVQDAMLKLTESYAGRPIAEIPLLFQRILQNTIRDFYRRSKVRQTWTPNATSFARDNEDDDVDYDILEHVEDEGAGSFFSRRPDGHLYQKQTLIQIEEALQSLPTRQREAFLLRYWEDMDVAETAQIMGCSEGSVKTHCFRAVHSLAKILESLGVNR